MDITVKTLSMTQQAYILGAGGSMLCLLFALIIVANNTTFSFISTAEFLFVMFGITLGVSIFHYWRLHDLVKPPTRAAA